MEEGKSVCKILKGKPTGKRTLERPRSRWEGNIRLNIKEIGVNARNGLIRLRVGIVEGPCECDIAPIGSINHRVSYFLI